KTALAVEVARRHTDGVVVLVDLAAVDDVDELEAVVADGLGLGAVDIPVAGAAGQSVERVIDALNSRPTLLLVDNCEHVVDAAAKLVHRLGQAWPPLARVAPSRWTPGGPGQLRRPG